MGSRRSPNGPTPGHEAQKMLRVTGLIEVMKIMIIAIILKVVIMNTIGNRVV